MLSLLCGDDALELLEATLDGGVPHVVLATEEPLAVECLDFSLQVYKLLARKSQDVD